jgi:hypothetical protein
MQHHRRGKWKSESTTATTYTEYHDESNNDHLWDRFSERCESRVSRADPSSEMVNDRSVRVKTDITVEVGEAGRPMSSPNARLIPGSRDMD